MECMVWSLYIPDPIYIQWVLINVSALTFERLSNCDRRSCSSWTTASAKMPVRLRPKGRKCLLVEQDFHLRLDCSASAALSPSMALCQAECSLAFSGGSEMPWNVFALCKTSRFKAESLAIHLLNYSSSKTRRRELIRWDDEKVTELQNCGRKRRT